MEFLQRLEKNLLTFSDYDCNRALWMIIFLKVVEVRHVLTTSSIQKICNT